MKKWLPIIARVFFGLILFASGVFSFVNKFAFPPGLPENLETFTTGLIASGYFLPFLKGTEIICGLMLIAGAFVPLALVVLAPIVIHIFLTHLFLAPEGMPVAIVLVVLQTYLSFFANPYRAPIRALFRYKS